MFKITESLHFKEDFKKYQEMIKNTDDPGLKKQLTSVFSEFVSAAKLIDRYHSDLALTGKIPTGISDARAKLFEHKKKLDTTLASHKIKNSKN